MVSMPATKIKATIEEKVTMLVEGEAFPRPPGARKNNSVTAYIMWRVDVLRKLTDALVKKWKDTGAKEGVINFDGLKPGDKQVIFEDGVFVLTGQVNKPTERLDKEKLKIELAKQIGPEKAEKLIEKCTVPNEPAKVASWSIK